MYVHEVDGIISAYGEWTAEFVAKGYDAIFLTFMLHPQRGSYSEIETQVQEALTAVYARTLTRIYRRPHARENADKLPRWIACPDYPVPKRAKMSLRDVVINGGRHWHAIVLVPPFCRLRVPFDRLINENPRLFAIGPISRVHAVSIDSDPSYVTGYGLKSISRGRASFDDLLILPRTKSELLGEGRPAARLL